MNEAIRFAVSLRGKDMTVVDVRQFFHYTKETLDLMKVKKTWHELSFMEQEQITQFCSVEIFDKVFKYLLNYRSERVFNEQDARTVDHALVGFPYLMQSMFNHRHRLRMAEVDSSWAF